MDPIAWLTLGLVLFAGIQVWIVYRAEKTRRDEREAADRRDEDLAYQTVWAEQFRLEGLADKWDATDLVGEIVYGVLEPSTVLSRDWSHIIGSLSRLSPESGYLGGVAFNLAHDVAEAIGRLRTSVGNTGDSLPTVDRVTYIRKHIGDYADQQQQIIKRGTRELSLLLADALAQAPMARRVRTLRFTDKQYSDLARNAVKALTARRSGPPPSDKSGG